MNATALQLPPPQLARLSVQLSADIYLPRAELQAKYPGAIIIPGGCDRGMVVRLEVSDQRPEASPTSYVFVVFEGTHDLKSLIADLAVKRHPYAGGEIHSGFDDGLMSMWDDILVAIHALARPGDLLVWSGHSRGASQCEDAACRWESLLAGPNPPSGPETALDPAPLPRPGWATCNSATATTPSLATRHFSITTAPTSSPGCRAG